MHDTLNSVLLHEACDWRWVVGEDHVMFSRHHELTTPLLRSCEDYVNAVLTVMEHSAQTSQDERCGMGGHEEGDVNGSQGAQHKAGSG